MLKRYYSIEEARAFLANETKTEFSERDLFDLAWRGEIGLCFYLGSVIMTLFHPADLSPVREFFEDGVPRLFVLPFQGYVCIDPADLRPDMLFPLEVTRYTPLENQLHDLVERQTNDHPPGRWLAYTPRVWRGGMQNLIPANQEPDVFKVNLDQLVIPAHHLLTLFDSPPKAAEKPPEEAAAASKSEGDNLGPRERDTLLKLVIGMAIAGYKYDPAAQRSEIPGEIVKDLQDLGIALTDDTVRKWLKKAAETVLPKKPRDT